MYLGSQKIKSTKSDEDYVLITFENKDKPVLKTSLEYIEALKSEKVMKDEDFAIKEQIFLAEEFYKVLLKHNIEVRVVDAVLNRLDYSLKVNSKNKFSQLLGKEFENRTVLDIRI